MNKIKIFKVLLLLTNCEHKGKFKLMMRYAKFISKKRSDHIFVYRQSHRFQALQFDRRPIAGRN